MKLHIKALSINEAYFGRRKRTHDYNNYIKKMLIILPEIDMIPEKNIRLNVEFGFSSYASDIDNGLKCFIDCLQKKYEFNDKNIIELFVRKTKVLKGFEYIDFYFY
jgi:Holliday junction resolvase RusA-like endonuclease